MKIIKTYYYLTKPGIIYGNSITAAGGFFLASHGQFHPALFIAMIAGLALIIASACVFNNLQDRDIDGLMSRTKNRALVKETVSARSALIFATVLGIFGSLILFTFTNLLALSVALGGLFFYAIVYTYFKRKTVHGTLIGCISGAVPPVVGYSSVTNHLNPAALLLFLVMVFWQMPHFYAIAIFRLRDYAAAHIPVISIVQGIPNTKTYIVLLITVFTLLASALTFFGYAGKLYLFAAIILGLSWLAIGLLNFKKQDVLWSRQMFRYSLVVIVFLFVVMTIDSATFKL